MYYIYHASTYNTYFFLTEEWFSGDFDSLEQLADVVLDDPDKVYILDKYPNSTLKDIQAAMLDEKDVTFLFKTSSLENLEEQYPEYFI